MGATAECICDTFSSDLGTILNKNEYVYNIIGFKKVVKGSNGGVSVIGYLCGLLGACIISFIHYYFTEDISGCINIIITSTFGNVLDSIFG